MLGIDFSYNKENFTVLLTSMFASNVSWYYHSYCLNHPDKVYCYPDNLNTKSYLKYFLTFKNNKLIK
jgi:hypothetical protein